MSIHVETFVLGPLENNSYLLMEDNRKEAIVVDPSIPSRDLLDAMRGNGLTLSYILITHAHFDHIGGAEWLKKQFNGKPQIVLHQADQLLWHEGGGAKDFGFDFDAGEKPGILINKDQVLQLDGYNTEILQTPGHTPGHVIFYFPDDQIAFCGDLIFYHGIGRTDLRNSSEKELYDSIQQKIFSLPGQTVLYPGHGPSTTVEEEKQHNPFLT